MQRGEEIAMQVKDQTKFMQFAWRLQTGQMQIWMMHIQIAPVRSTEPYVWQGNMQPFCAKQNLTLWQGFVRNV